jgi:predicted metal-dependent hydrolase
MPSKEFTLNNGTAITVYKHKASRSLRLSIAASGKVRVSIPAWVAYAAGRNFAQSREAWIQQQRQPGMTLVEGQAVGKSHHLQFVPAASVQTASGRVAGTSVVVTYPAGQSPASASVQRAAESAGIRALRRQAEQLLPQRLAQLAAVHGFEYRSVTIKRLKSRWGSCDQHGNITLNLFLMQLPWELIDYVLLHELTHTRILRHGPDFWQAMAEVSPGSKLLRKQLRQHQPIITGTRQIALPVA